MGFNYNLKGHDREKQLKEIDKVRASKAGAEVDKQMLGPIHTINVKFSKDGFAVSKTKTFAAMTKTFITTGLHAPTMVKASFKSLDEYINFLRATIDDAFVNLQDKINAVDTQDLSDLEKDKAKWFLARDYQDTLVETLRNAEKAVASGENVKPFEQYFAKGGALSNVVTFQVGVHQYSKSSEETSSRQ